MSKLFKRRNVESTATFGFTRNDNKMLDRLEKTVSRDVFIREYISNRAEKLIIS